MSHPEVEEIRNFVWDIPYTRPKRSEKQQFRAGSSGLDTLISLHPVAFFFLLVDLVDKMSGWPSILKDS